jgi:hypothetical protein
MRPTTLPQLFVVAVGISMIAGCDKPPPTPPPPTTTTTVRPKPPKPPTPPPTTDTTTKPPKPPKPPTPPPQTTEPPPPILSENDAERAAYSMRRLGHLVGASVAYDKVLEVLPNGPERRLVGAEAVELARVMGRLDRVLKLCRKMHDVRGEIEVLFELDRAAEALSVARLMRYPKGEVEALARLGKIDEALRLCDKHDLQREAAEVLARAGRNAEAVAAFAELPSPDFFAQAQLLDTMGDQSRAKRAYSDAQIQLTDDLQHIWLPRLQRAEEHLRRAPDVVARERSRMGVARALGQVSEQYEKLAIVFARTSQPQDRTILLAQNAKRFTERQVQTILDTGAQVPDEYGKKLVDHLKLPARIATLERWVKERSGGR